MRITVLGDLMVTQRQLRDSQNGNKYDFSGTLSMLKDTLQKSDYVIANLETVIAGEKAIYTSSSYSFNTPIEFLTEIKESGIDALITANNHCLDRGVLGLKKTVQSITGKGLDVIGTHLIPEEAFRMIEMDGIKVAIIAFTYGTNAFDNHNYLIKKQKYMVDLFQEQELSTPLIRYLNGHSYFARVYRRVCRKIGFGQYDKPVYERREKKGKYYKHYIDTIHACKDAGANLIVACLHVGGQFNSIPTDLAKRICQESIAAGVDVVIANHEHVIQNIDNTVPDNKFCIYSLGNCLSSYGISDGPFDKMCEYSVAVNIDIDSMSNEVQYSISILCSFEKNGIIVCEFLFDLFEKSSSNERKKN